MDLVHSPATLAGRLPLAAIHGSRWSTGAFTVISSTLLALDMINASSVRGN